MSWLGWALSSLGLMLVFVAALVGGALLHLDVRAARKLVVGTVNQVLAAMPDDHVKIGELRWLGLRGVTVAAVDADIAGVGRGHAERITVKIDVLRTVWHLATDLIGKRHVIRIDLGRVEVDSIDFLLALGERPATPPSSEPSNLEIRVAVQHVELGHAYVHGALANGQIIDADMNGMRAKVALDGKHAEGTISAAVVGRAVPGAPVHLVLDGDVWVGLGSSVERRAKANLHVESGDAVLTAVASLTNDTFEAELDLAETSAATIRAMLPGTPIYQPVSARVRATGTLPRIDFHVEATAGKGTLKTDGHLQLDAGPAVEASVAARDIDIAAFLPGDLHSALGLDASVGVRLMPATGKQLPLSGVVTLRTVTGKLAGLDIPVVTARVELSPDQAHATATVAETGMPIQLTVDRGANGQIRADFEATAPSLAEVARLRELGLDARGHLSLTASATLRGNELDVRAGVSIADVALAGVTARSVRLDATARGPLESPLITLSGRITWLQSGAQKISELSLDARGTPAQFSVGLVGWGGTVDELSLEASSVEPGKATHIRGIVAHIVHAGQTVNARLSELTIAPSSLTVDALRVEGLGEPMEASLRQSRTGIVARVVAPRVDLVRVGGLLGIGRDKLGGVASIDLALAVDGRQKATARTQVRLTGVHYLTAPVLDAAVDLTLDGRAIQGTAHLESAEIGKGELSVDAVLGAAPLDPGAFDGAVGKVVFSIDRVALNRLCPRIGCSDELGRAVSSVGMAVGMHVEVVRTAKLAAGADTQVHLTVAAEDVHGALGHLAASTELDLRKTLRTGRIPSDTSVEAEFALEKRTLDQLPVSFRPPGLSGSVELHGYVQGNAEEPFLVVEVAGHDLHYGQAGRGQGPPLDVQVVATYDLEKAAVQIEATSGQEKVLQASADLNAVLRDLLDAKDSSSARWTAGLYADIHRFPLAFLPAFSQNGLAGMLSGKVSVSGIHDKPAVAASFTVEDLRAGKNPVGTFVVAVQADEHQCVASVDGHGAGGAAALARVGAGCQWKDATVPSLDPAKQVEVALDTTAFPLVALAPALSSVVQRLGGTLDLHLRASGHPDLAATDWSLQGTAQIQKGNMLPLAIGREIHRLDLKLTLGTDGVHIEKFAGELGGGTFTGTGALELKNRTVTGGRLELHIPSRRPMPVTAEGVSYGNVWGDIYADARVTNGRLDVNLKAPTLRFELPPQSTANLETLEDNPAIAVVQTLDADELDQAVGPPSSPLFLLPSGITISLELGNNVGISRDDLKVELQTLKVPGNPRITIDNGMHLAGTIRILGGRVPVVGKTFQIERGTVLFGGSDPTNPALDIYAVYETSGSTVSRIDVHVSGTAKDIKLTLTSTPPKPQNELLAILAFGDEPPGSASSSSGGSGASQGGGSTSSGATAAAGVGAAVLNQGINQILSQSIIPVRASLQGSTGASATVDLTERIRVEYIRQFTAPTTQQSGQPVELNQIAFDWRFKPRWMLRTMVGDKGTTVLDVLWQRWY